jgi:hypothetical protein
MRRLSPLFAAGLLCYASLTTSAGAAGTTQTLDLDLGWNAVWLDISPLDTNGQAAAVADVFTNVNIMVVARPENAVSSAQFITDPGSDGFDLEGWGVWRRASVLGENTLATVLGNQAYLMHVENLPISLDVTGEVVFFRPNWSAGSYNLIGFGFTQADAVTFEDFFRASNGAHPADSIFRLDATSGNWFGVNSTDFMQPGESYWIFASRASTYAGPVAISFGGITDLSFGTGPGTVEVQDPQNAAETILLSREEVIFSNLDTADRSIGMEKVDPATTGAAAINDRLRLYEIAPDADLEKYQITGQIVSLNSASVTSQTSEVVTLGAHRNWDSGERSQENLYRIVIDNQYFWLPAGAANPDLPAGTLGSPAPDYTGLWVGQAVLDTVTSLTESGVPLRDTTSVLPVQIVIHVDSNGTPSLLSHVMVMQTETADETVDPEMVLVVNEEKIPFFEGIEERGGKRIGRRIETVSFDMPRKTDLVTQSNLLAEVGAAFNFTNVNQVAESNLVAYVNSRSSRPPALVEDYHLSWPMDGGLAPGNAIQTPANQPLTQDAFHRSNPFRHAFHPQHGAGFAIERTIRLAFDQDLEAGRLTGVYEETTEGLAAMTIQTEGTFMLDRVSDVGELQ